MALLCASHLYLAWLSVTFAKIVNSAETDLSDVFKIEFIYEKRWERKKEKKKTISRKEIFHFIIFFYVQTFLSFLYQVKAAKGLPPDDTQRSLWTVPAGIIEPSTYPDIIGGDGGSNNIII